MTTGTTSDVIDEPKANQIAIFQGRDEGGKFAYAVRISLEGGGFLNFAISDSTVLHDASTAFATAAARSNELLRYRVRDLLEVIGQAPDIEEAGDDDFISYISDVQGAAGRLA